MAGGILQLVTTMDAPQNIWLNSDPQITFFKRVYRRHTPFAREFIKVPFASSLDFGNQSSTVLPRHGDLVHRVFLMLDIPPLAAEFTRNKTQDIYNITNNTIFTDEKFMCKLRYYAIDKEQVELDKIFELVEHTLDTYDCETNENISILESIDKFETISCIEDCVEDFSDNAIQSIESESCTESVREARQVSYDTKKFKQSLRDRLICAKSMYAPIYHIVEEFRENYSDYLSQPLCLDNKCLLQNLIPDKSIIDSSCSLFGKQFHETLDIYNTCINILRTLGRTVPIVTANVFELVDTSHNRYNIYQDELSVPIDNSVTNEIVIDPNFKANFMLNAMGTLKPVESTEFIPVDFTTTFEIMYNETNPLMQLFNREANRMFNTIQYSMQKLYESYRMKLFDSTEKLFYQNSPPYTNVYAYTVPTINYQDNSEYRTSNVFNANIWYFYFFKYLDLLDAKAFASYLANCVGLSSNAQMYLIGLINLLKINIEYYMNESSYLANDMYAESPSTNPKDNMKNYSPMMYNQQIQSNLLTVTIIFHRSHIPSIIEMFEFIYHWIDTITLDNINCYLDCAIPEIEMNEVRVVKSALNSLYHGILAHFVNVYDSFGFEAKSSDFFETTCNDQVIEKYLDHFIRGQNDSIEGQISICQTLNQMEFYFVAEMINSRQTQKLYDSIFTEDHNLDSKVNELINRVVGAFNKLSTADLYYQTRRIDRFNGKSYIDTSYESRFNGLVMAPIADPVKPPPPSVPYGINPNYYEHRTPIDFAQLATSNQHILPSEIASDCTSRLHNLKCNTQSNLAAFQTFEIDYFRIRHSLLDENYPESSEIKFVDEYQFNLQRALKLTNQLAESKFFCVDIFNYISVSIYYLLQHVESESIDVLASYFDKIEASIRQKVNLVSNDEISCTLSVLNDLDRKLPDRYQILTASAMKSNSNEINQFVDSTANIIDQIILLRNNFLTQYNYYATNSTTITRLIEYRNTDLLDIFTNVCGLDTTLLCSIYPSAFDCKDTFVANLDVISEFRNGLDDFALNLFDTILFDSNYLNLNPCAIINSINSEFALMESNGINPLETYYYDGGDILLGGFVDGLLDHIWIQAIQYSFEINSCDTFTEFATETNRIVNDLKDTIRKQIIILNQQKTELAYFKHQMETIMYRDKLKARCAWIRNLGHYIVERCSVKCGDQVINSHTSDWLESFRNLSRDPSNDRGYNKMIANIDHLTTFDLNPKCAYTIVLPLVFYFNLHPALSLPLNASINTQHEISVKLRTLDDVSYKEEFADFVNNDKLKITNAHLMVEYIYLSNEERRIFASNCLEYLIDELQYEQTDINDQNLEPVRKTQIANSGSKFITQRNQNHFDVELVERNDYRAVQCANRNGLVQMQMVNAPIEGLDKLVHQKRAKVKNYFNNPAKYMVVLIRPKAHIDSSFRDYRSNYFHGEKQWDNYGLNPYYDLSRIYDAKSKHYRQIVTSLNDIDNCNLGFVNILNQLLLDPVATSNNSGEYIQLIKDSYINYDGVIYNRTYLVELKEKLIKLKINYHVVSEQMLVQMVSDIYSKLGTVMPDFDVIFDHFSLQPDQYVTKEFITGRVIKLHHRLIQNYSITESEICKVIQTVYCRYNESVIEILIYEFDRIFCMEPPITSNLACTIDLFTKKYCELDNSDPTISNALDQIRCRIKSMGTINQMRIRNSTFKDIINQCLLCGSNQIYFTYSNIVPYQIVRIISGMMQHKLNQLFDTMDVCMINYQDNMIPITKVNPLRSVNLEFNDTQIIPCDTPETVWNQVNPYTSFRSTPKIGINVHSWSFNPTSLQPSGSANLSKINDFTSIFDVDPSISDRNPATITTMISSINIMRYLSGMCGKAWC